MRRIAIVGSRDYPNEEEVREFVRNLPKDTVVISGGARGVDTWAAGEAWKRGLKVVVYKAQWNKYGKSAGYLRNRDIVNDCDEVVAFWDGHSRGTQHTIRIAAEAGKPVRLKP